MTLLDQDAHSKHVVAPVRIITLLHIVWLVEGIVYEDIGSSNKCIGWPLKNCDIECYFERDSTLDKNPELVKSADAIFYTNVRDVHQFYDPKKVNLIFASESFLTYPGM
jgi:hypothetical protein